MASFVDDQTIEARGWMGALVMESTTILSFVRERSAANVRGFTTGRNKVHPEFGLDGLFTDFANGKWILRNINGEMEPENRALVDDMLINDPVGHTSDRLMALWLAGRVRGRAWSPWRGRSLGLRRR